MLSVRGWRCSACAIPPSSGTCRRLRPAPVRWAEPRGYSCLRHSPLASHSDTDGFAEPDLAVLLPSSTSPPYGLRTTVLYGMDITAEPQSCRNCQEPMALLCKADYVLGPHGACSCLSQFWWL